MVLKYLIFFVIFGGLASKAYQKYQLEVLDAMMIRRCTVPGTIALTFDDGPMPHTNKILDDLEKAGMRATFFVNGKNWSNVTDYPETIQRMMMMGHQVGSHTWNHVDLTAMSDERMIYQMGELDRTLIEMTGKRPTYMRPPYFAINRKVIETLTEWNYHIVHSSHNTYDWSNHAEKIHDSVRLFEEGLRPGLETSIVLSHDVWEETANVLVPEMIKIVKKRGLKAVTVGECVGDAPENWYTTE